MGEKVIKNTEKDKMYCKHNSRGSSGGSAVYGLGLIGALIYFIQNADGFWMGVLGILQAIIWPVIMVYKLLENFMV